MNFELNQEQQQLADSVRRMIEKDYDFETRKKIVASPEGHSPTAWATFAELGLLGLPLSEDSGGFGGGAVDLISVMEAIGAGLVLEPYLSTVGVAARLIDRHGSAALKAAVLPAVVDGRLKMALAHYERGGRFDNAAVGLSATRAGAGHVLSGEKIAVIDAPLADKLLVSARTSGKAGDAAGISLFVVDAKAAGVSMKTYRTQDSLRGAEVRFDKVTVPAEGLVGAEGQGLAMLEEALDFAGALLCAEAVGAMKFACDTTLEYLKTRKQFGQNIGAFQALQHRMVDMCISTEQARSITYLACAKVGPDTPAAERSRVVAAARVKVADACRHVGQEAIQLHGGMGMTLEMKVSHTFKRLTMISQAFGDADYHLGRFSAAA
ncbi:MAG TPA: acyl-CoA dehydrogenase [Burkholderiaceae bacterium]|nr:acyl-CoA dehydrogenase [Burkholderiaceae bacterium]